MDARIGELKRRLQADPSDEAAQRELDRLERRINLDEEESLWPQDIFNIMDQNNGLSDTIEKIFLHQKRILEKNTKEIITANITKSTSDSEINYLFVIKYNYAMNGKAISRKKSLFRAEIDSVTYPVDFYIGNKNGSFTLKRATNEESLKKYIREALDQSYIKSIFEEAAHCFFFEREKKRSKNLDKVEKFDSL